MEYPAQEWEVIGLIPGCIAAVMDTVNILANQYYIYLIYNWDRTETPSIMIYKDIQL